MTGHPMRRVERLRYDTHRFEEYGPLVNVLVVELDNGEVLRVPNGGWTTDNPALQVLAYLGVSPSTMDDAEGERFLPVEVVRSGDGAFEYEVPRMVLDHGRANLRRADWFVAAVEDYGGEEARGAPNSGSGGGGDPAV